MKVGSLYSCKWKPFHHSKERGWDMLMFLGMKGSRYYHFYDILLSSKCVLDEGLIKYCKQITKEEKCTQ